jgi:DNA-binding XRE family transcriptional regulator
MKIIVDKISHLSDTSYMFDKSSIADRIKKYRLDRCWTQGQMANRLGIDKTAICKMERGKYIWTDLTLARIVRKLPDLCDSEQHAGTVSAN